MHSIYQYNHYVIKRQFLALTGIIRVYDPYNHLAMFSRQKMFRLKEDIRVYLDESRSQELLYIQARNIIDFSAAYDIFDQLENMKVGVLKRKGMRSLLQDEWHIFDENENFLAILQEDTRSKALLRRFLLGRLLPQTYFLRADGVQLAIFRQPFHMFRYALDVYINQNVPNQIDKRLVLAAGILLATIEGSQES